MSTTTTTAATTTARPDLVQMDIADPSDPSSSRQQDASDDNSHQHPHHTQHNSDTDAAGDQPFCSPLIEVVVALIFLIAFLVLSLIDAQDRAQFLSLSCFALPVVLAGYLHFNRKTMPLQQMIIRFVIGFVLLLPLVALLAFVIVMVFAFLLGPVLDKNSDEDARFFNIKLLFFILSLVSAEELVKVFIFLFKDRRDRVARPEHFVYFGCATALGLGSAEIFFTVREVSFFLRMPTAEGEGGQHFAVPISVVLMLVGIFSAFVLPMMMLSSYYLGMAAARVQMLEKSSCQELPAPVALSILFRTMFYSAYLIVAVQSNFWLGFALMMGSYFIFIWLVLRYQSFMPSEYLRATGYLHVAGYGVLPGNEDAAADAAANAASAEAASAGRSGAGAAAVGPAVGGATSAYDDDNHEFGIAVPPNLVMDDDHDDDDAAEEEVK